MSKIPVFLVLAVFITACGAQLPAAVPDTAAMAVVIQSTSIPILTPTTVPTETPVLQPGVHILLNVYPPDGEYTFIRLTLSSTTADPLGQIFVYIFINGIQVNGEVHETWGHPCSDTAIAQLACDVKVTMFQSFTIKVTREGKSCNMKFKIPLNVNGDTFIENQACAFGN